MRSVIVAIILLAGFAFAIWAREAHAGQDGDLYAFCDGQLPTQCNERALMLKDVCETTLRYYTDGPPRFWCYRVDQAAIEAYLKTVDRDVYERTIEAWRAGR